ncbi:ABC-three component system protein [Ralstonia sp. 24A2]|uniref:ABC-three component system protein n=1 Tax=Ralstonia sp. 24A2 TaxID=3447364 RepID=UPI003F6A4954
MAFETLGDVAVEGGKSTLAEEDKSGLSHNPIANSSPSLWKTFANWADARRDGVLPASCKYILYVAQPYDGDFVQKLSDCHSYPEAQRLVGKLRREMLPTETSGGETDNIGATLQTQLLRLFAHSDSAIANIVVDFTLEKTPTSPIDEVRGEIARSEDDEHVNEIVESLLGWVNAQLMTHIKNGVPARIAYSDFRRRRLAVTKRVTGNLKAFPESELVVTQAQIAAEFTGSIYVRQLHLLNLKNDDIAAHISDFLRASAQRTELSDAGYLNRTSFGRYERDLVERWNISRQEIEYSSSSKSAIKRGIDILFRCLKEDAQLQALSLPRYFIRGSFHSIANEPRIGWHPDWKKLLGVDEKESGHAA